MSFLRLGLAAVAVATWFGAWAFGVRRITGDAAPLRLGLAFAEAALLTAFAALWFGSLGHGGWWLLFGVVALLIEGPVRLRHRAEQGAGPFAWPAILLGLVRFLGAGLVLSLLL